MKFLLTNDDGIDAPGLAALYRAVEGWGERIVVAPLEPQSGCSHRVTTERPFRVLRRAEDWYAVDGSPADCARVGLSRLVPDVDWILSGVNEGGNLGADVYLSGTVAAVREGVLHGTPGVAVSQYRRKGAAIRWEEVTKWARGAMKPLLERKPDAGVFWNVNLPHYPESPARMPEIARCPLDPAPLPLSFREVRELEGEEGLEFEPGCERLACDDIRLAYTGVYHDRRRQPGSDVDVCFGGRIAVTELRLF